MKGKIMIALLMALVMVGGVMAVVSPPATVTPNGFTNSDAVSASVSCTRPSADFRVDDDPLFLTTIIDQSLLNVGGICSANINIFSLTPGLTYYTKFVDSDGSINSNNLIRDISVDVADMVLDDISDYTVSYTPLCNDLISGIATTNPQYNYGGGVWSGMTGNPLVMADGDGNYEFKTICTDVAGNVLESTVRSAILPASPPDLQTTTRVGVGVICTLGYPCSETMTGVGNPLDINLKLSFNELASLDVVLDSGAPVVISDMYKDHIISLMHLVTGIHTLLVTASDGVNEDTYSIILNVQNAGSGGSSVLDIRGSTPIIEPSVSFVGNPVVVKNDILPGDFAVVRYTLSMLVEDNLQFYFESTSNFFDTPIEIACTYNAGTDTLGPTQYTISTVALPGAGVFDATPSMICPGTGTLSTGYSYDVYVKYPVTIDAIEGPINGELFVQQDLP